MIKALFFFFSTVWCLQSFGQQVYHVGVVSSGDYIMKLPGEIVFADSTVTFKFEGKQTSKKIVNRTESVVYVTDGTAVDRITITPMVGSIKGLNYNVTVVVDPDAKFRQPQIIYFTSSRH